jgi:hypothetical protein
VGFIRRYNSDPGLAEIRAIEGTVIIDREPPAVITGIQTGHAVMVAEFEDGPFNTPTALLSGDDLTNLFGGFGFTYNGVTANNPCARSRKADGSLVSEYWNGNGFISLVNKRFGSLSVVRADTSVGSVRFSRQASVSSTISAFSFGLTSGQILSFDIGAGAVDTTFTGVAANVNSGAGSYPTAFAGGEKFTVTIDEGTPQQIGPVVITFQDGDESQAQCIARINEFLGYTCATTVSATVIKLTARVGGTSGNVKIAAVDAAVGTKLGFVAGTTAGTGNVADITQVKVSEIASLVATASSNAVLIAIDGSGYMRATNASTSPGAAITVHANTTAANLGFVAGTTATNAVGTAGVIPAGTRVRNSGGEEWVTMQTIAVTADSPGPYDVKVRPADDDGTTPSAATGTVNVVPYAIEVGSFGVTNLLPLSAALSEAAIDAAYVAAIASTEARNAVTRTAGLIVSARQSNAVRSALKANAINASKNLYGRIAVIRPPLKTLRSVAKSTTSQPGVGAYRDRRVVYAYPGVETYVPQIAVRGVAGLAGFTDSGMIDTGFDTWVASAISQLAPEENPGQLTEFMALATGIERGNADVQNLTELDYRAFKASGIAAPILDGSMSIQSGITTVDPLVNPSLVNIARQRMSDFITDTLAQRYKNFEKKTNTRTRRANLVGETDGYLNGLKGQPNSDNQRIDAYSIDAKSPNTPDTLGLGIFRVRICVRTLSSLDNIVLDATIGETVTITDVTT